MDETGLKLLLCFDVKKRARQQTATPNCPFLLKGSAVQKSVQQKLNSTVTLRLMCSFLL